MGQTNLLAPAPGINRLSAWAENAKRKAFQKSKGGTVAASEKILMVPPDGRNIQRQESA